MSGLILSGNGVSGAVPSLFVSNVLSSNVLSQSVSTFSSSSNLPLQSAGAPPSSEALNAEPMDADSDFEGESVIVTPCLSPVGASSRLVLEVSDLDDSVIVTPCLSITKSPSIPLGASASSTPGVPSSTGTSTSQFGTPSLISAGSGTGPGADDLKTTEN